MEEIVEIKKCRNQVLVLLALALDAVGKGHQEQLGEFGGSGRTELGGDNILVLDDVFDELDLLINGQD